MNAKRKAQIRAEHDRRISRLPEWLQNVDDYVTYRLTHDAPRHRDADEWIQHGADMLTKIQQLLDVQEIMRDALIDAERTIGALLADTTIPAVVRGAALSKLENVRGAIAKARHPLEE